jgi:hypothetical protein
MDAPADTLNFMIAGYSVIFGGLIVYLVSLAVRWRSLSQDEVTLKDLEKDEPAS